MKENFEYDKWYLDTACPKAMVYIANMSYYGFNVFGDWVNCKDRESPFKYSVNLVPATEEEVEKRLLEYAKETYPKGTKYKDVDDVECAYVKENLRCFKTLGGQVYITDGNGGSVYFDGKWAEAVSVPEVSSSNVEDTKQQDNTKYDLSTTITRAVENDDPSIIVKETGKSVEDLCELVDRVNGYCLGSEFGVLCSGLSCILKCPFSKNPATKESAKAWLRGSFKKSLSDYDAVRVDTQDKWDFVRHYLGRDMLNSPMYWSQLKEKSCIFLKSEEFAYPEYCSNVLSFEQWLELTGNIEVWLSFRSRNRFEEGQESYLLGRSVRLTNDNSNNFYNTKKEAIFVSLEEDDIVEYEALPVQECSNVEFVSEEE